MEFKINPSEQSGEIKISESEMDKISGYVDKIIPGFVKEGVGMLTDQFKYRRGSRQLMLMKKWVDKVEKSGLSIKDIEPKLFLPIIENGSLEKDDSLQEKWANMLFNASTTDSVLVGYTQILKELGQKEVQVLDKLYDEAKTLSMAQQPKGLIDIQFSTEKISKNFGIDIEECKLMIDNFFRLRLAEAPEFMGMSAGGYHPVLKTNMIFQLTTLGVKFIEACKS